MKKGKGSPFVSISFSQGAGSSAGRAVRLHTPAGTIQVLVHNKSTTESCRIQPVRLDLAAP